MIDWITAKIPFRHDEPIFGGTVMCFDKDGAEKWHKESFRELKGSWESTSVIKTFFRSDRAARAGDRDGDFREIWISGNPAKFLQGHNLFGSDNLTALAPLYFRSVLEACGLVVDDFTFRRWVCGEWELDRVDVAMMLDVGGPQEVRDVLSALAHQSTYVNRGRGLINAGTITWGKRGSRQTVIKAYDKHGEAVAGPKSHRIPEGIPERDALCDYCTGKVRVEVEFHSKALAALALRKGSGWHTDTAAIQWENAMSRLNISGQIPLTPDVLKALPRKLQNTYMKWETGRDLRGWMSPSSYKRHRKELLAYGIDIGQTFNSDREPRVVSLQKVLHPVPVSAPQWARGTSLLAAA